MNGKGNIRMRNERMDVLALPGLAFADLAARHLVVAAWECDPLTSF